MNLKPMNQKPTQLSIDPCKIRTDLDTHAREKICDETVKIYAEAMKNGARFPPITVFFDRENEQYILADGFHRLFAHLRVKPNDPIIIEQYLGNVKDAILHSVGSNKSHGLRRSNEDKRNFVELALLHPYSVGMSDRQVADHVGVSSQMVSATRRRLVAEGRLAESTHRVGKDGRTYNFPNGLTTRKRSGRHDEALDQAVIDTETEKLPPDNHRQNNNPWVIVVRLDDLPRLVEILHNNTNLKTNEHKTNSTEH